MTLRKAGDIIATSTSICAEIEEAQTAGMVGFVARVLTLATLPHRKVNGNEFTRRNGNYVLTMTVPSNIGLPFGIYPRVVLCWLITEAIQRQTATIELGSTLAGFMKELGITPTGGKTGTITRLHDQMRRLFSTSVSCSFTDRGVDSGLGFRISSEHQLWWDPYNPNQGNIWNSVVKLSEDFFQEIITRPVPINLLAFTALKDSPMALDIYCWLTYRMSYTKCKTGINWESLQMQFGAEYANDPQGLRNFKKNFSKQLKRVNAVYPEANVETNSKGLILRPSRAHVPQSNSRLVISSSQQSEAYPKQIVGSQKGVRDKADVSSEIRLSPGVYEKAKLTAPRMDIYALEQEWREWMATKEKPLDPDAAFLGFCRTKYAKKAGIY